MSECIRHPNDIPVPAERPFRLSRYRKLHFDSVVVRTKTIQVQSADADVRNCNVGILFCIGR